jgi:dihydroorotate dehydrogenase
LAAETPSSPMFKVLIRPILFLFDPEKIHHFTFRVLGILSKIPGVKSLWRALYTREYPGLEQEIFGLKFKNPVGLAAGFDKDARRIDVFDTFGFGFIEIGTLTPKAQEGNPLPRLFRLPADGAIINRMGFNNQGVKAAVERLKRRKSKVIVGGNIGKNKATPNEQALEDYAYCFEALYAYVDYFVVNVSSPNTPGLRELQEKEPLTKLLAYVKKLSMAKHDTKPVLLKIAPDLTDSQLEDIVEILKTTGTDGVIATNTTISREGLKSSADRVEEIGAGGLSGAPVKERSTEVIRFLRDRLGPQYPIIGVGGIMKPEDALEKLKAGANLIQIYTGFVYNGPAFIGRINRLLAKTQWHN